MAGKIKITLERSRSKANSHQRKILDGLGLSKRQQTRELQDTPSIRGMVKKVSHLISVANA